MFNRKGQGMTEYILIIFLVVIVAIAALKLFGGKVKKGYETAAEEVGSATTVQK